MSHLSLFLAVVVRMKVIKMKVIKMKVMMSMMAVTMMAVTMKMMKVMMSMMMVMTMMMMAVPALKEGDLLASVKVEIASTVRSLNRPLKSNHP